MLSILPSSPPSELISRFALSKSTTSAANCRFGTPPARRDFVRFPQLHYWFAVFNLRVQVPSPPLTIAALWASFSCMTSLMSNRLPTSATGTFEKLCVLKNMLVAIPCGAPCHFNCVCVIIASFFLHFETVMNVTLFALIPICLIFFHRMRQIQQVQTPSVACTKFAAVLHFTQRVHTTHRAVAIGAEC